LAETFQRNPDQKKKFERWRSCKYIVVYDASATKTKDAMACINMLKKFATEGWNGTSHIIRGGFHEFSRQFPALIQHDSDSVSSGNSPTGALGSPGHSLAPVIGGCPMPATKSAANPFFGNIRQNMDLIGGVGQISVQLPSSMTVHQMEDVPRWLRAACDKQNNGKAVADKFLAIEKAEQCRMQEALSSNVSYSRGTPRNSPAQKVQIAGIEKGSKNRYNNIWPYEHSRVKIQQVPEGSCDYINANHVKAAWSHKRYIATQGPIPATFNDFWNVVWQQDVRVIVMLTAETESGQVKAHNYWSQKNFGPVHLNFLSEHRASLEPSKIHRHRDRPAAGRRRSTNPHFGRPPPKQEEESHAEQPYVIVRKFTMSRNDSPFERMREITQLQYSHWPDFGAPAHPAHLLGLVEQCDTVLRASGSGSASGPAPEDSRPILVHCSAGCGRTGTFCTVDSVIDMLKRQRVQRGHVHARQLTPMEVDSGLNNSRTGSTTTLESSSSGSSAASSPLSGMGERNWIIRDDIDLVEKTVEDFRDERLSMVQSLRQFVLCYESVLEWMVEQTPRSA
jgi:protein-tyrosine phosphatase